jgi:hypothetical protein
MTITIPMGMLHAMVAHGPQRARGRGAAGVSLSTVVLSSMRLIGLSKQKVKRFPRALAEKNAIGWK